MSRMDIEFGHVGRGVLTAEKSEDGNRTSTTYLFLFVFHVYPPLLKLGYRR